MNRSKLSYPMNKNKNKFYKQALINSALKVKINNKKFKFCRIKPAYYKMKIKFKYRN